MKSEKDQKDDLFSMRVVAKLTGLTPDTIRVWERRYGAVSPARTAGDTRQYTHAEVGRLILLRRVTALGRRIKTVATLPDEELQRIIDELEAAATPPETEGGPAVGGDYHRAIVNEYITAVRAFDAQRAQRLLNRASLLMDPHEFAMKVVVPILQEAGDHWFHKRFTIAHEHLISMQIRALLIKLIDMTSPLPGAEKILVTTPSGHRHEFGVLVGALLAASRGLTPVYLGPDTPVEDILKAIEMSRVNLVLLSVVRDVNQEELDSLGDALHRLSDAAEVWLGLPADHAANRLAHGARVFHDFATLEAALTQRVS